MLTGVIYAAIVVAWAAYLVPLALRRRDEASRSRSIERFSSAMRVLSRRSTRTAGRVVLAPRQSVRRLVGPDAPAATAPASGKRSPRQETPAKPASPPAVPGVSLRRKRQAEAAAARRRRRVLGLLAALGVATIAVAALGLFPWWAVAVPAGMVAVFLIAARRTVRRASDAYWEQAIGTVDELEPSNVLRRSAARVDVPAGGRAVASADDEATVTLDDAALAAAANVERHVAMPVQSSDGGSMWDPLPVTLPTYVDKPVARRTVRKIDLGSSDTFSSGHLAGDAALVQEQEAAEEADESVPDKKVVNG